MPMNDDLHPVFPSEKIKCKTCMFKKPGIIGYKNAYCDVYTNGKPNDILFKEADCEYYRKEAAEKS